MPHWQFIGLLGIFTIHLIVFLRLTVKRRKSYYALAAFSFFLLILSLLLHLWMPALELGGRKVYWYLRVGGWLTAGLSVLLMIVGILQHIIRRKKNCV